MVSVCLSSGRDRGRDRGFRRDRGCGRSRARALRPVRLRFRRARAPDRAGHRPPGPRQARATPRRSVVGRRRRPRTEALAPSQATPGRTAICRAPSRRHRSIPSSRSGSPPDRATSTSAEGPNCRTSRAIRNSSASSNGEPVGATTNSASDDAAAARPRNHPTRWSAVPSGDDSTRGGEFDSLRAQLEARAASATRPESRPRVIGTTQTGSVDAARAVSIAAVRARPPATTVQSGETVCR